MTELDIMRQAKKYMDQLAQGIDPISGQPVPNDSTLNNLRLARCFFYVSGLLEQVIANGGIHPAAAPQISRYKPFSITEEQLVRIPISQEPIGVTQIAKRINDAVGDPEMKSFSGMLIANWLEEKGFLEKQMGPTGKARRVPSQAGLQLGITTATREGANGDYLAVLYASQAQRFILDHISEMLT